MEGKDPVPMTNEEFDRHVEEGKKRWGSMEYDFGSNQYKFHEGTERKLEDIPIRGPNGGIMVGPAWDQKEIF